MKKILSILLSFTMIISVFSGCKQNPKIETGTILDTNGSFENEHLSFNIPIGWETKDDPENPNVPQLISKTKPENGFTPFINFHFEPQNDAFMTFTDKEVDLSNYYSEYTLLENELKKIKDNDVRVTRYKLGNSGITIFLKIYAFNSNGRTYNLSLSSPDETSGIDALFTVYNSFSGKAPVSTKAPTTVSEESTTVPEYNIDTAFFRVFYPENWISDVTGRNKKVDQLQYWYSRHKNNIPIFTATEPIDDFYPYISVIIGEEDKNLIEQEDKYLNFSASFKNYEQGTIEHGIRNNEKTLTLHYSVENDEGKRVYITQILFNEYHHLFIISLFGNSEDCAVKELQKFYDTFYVLNN